MMDNIGATHVPRGRFTIDSTHPHSTLTYRTQQSSRDLSANLTMSTKTGTTTHSLDFVGLGPVVGSDTVEDPVDGGCCFRFLSNVATVELGPVAVCLLHKLPHPSA